MCVAPAHPGRNEDTLREPLTVFFPLCAPGLDAENDDPNGHAAAANNPDDDGGGDGRAQKRADGLPQPPRSFANAEQIMNRITLWLLEERGMRTGMADMLAAVAPRWGHHVVLDM